MRLVLITFCLFLQTIAFAGTVQLEDNQGRTIQAKLIGVDDGYLTILRDDGRRYTFALTMLSGKSQELVKKEFMPAPEPTAPAAGPQRGAADVSLNVDFRFSATPPGQIEVTLFNSDTRKKQDFKVDAGAKQIDLSGMDEGDYTISFEADDYAYQWYRLSLKKGRVSPSVLTLDFRRKRYVVIRYAINLSGGPDLSGADLYTGTAAFSDLKYGNPQHFLGWRLRQANPGEIKYGDSFFLQWKWMVPNAGVCVRRGSFDGIKSTRNDKFQLAELELKKGLVFTCKSSYTRTENMQGKFEVLDVVDEPAPGMDVY